jgi:acetyl esterase/lipase
VNGSIDGLLMTSPELYSDRSSDAADPIVHARLHRDLRDAAAEMSHLDISDIASARAIAAEPNSMAEVRSEVEAVAQLEIEDVRVQASTGPHEFAVRVYRPSGPGYARAGLLFIHGGGFMLGDLDMEHLKAVDFCVGADCVVVSVDYRLAPEYPFPAGLDDCYDALVWLSANAEELGVDPARLGVAGTSAGGCLAAGVTLLARDRGGPRMLFQLLTYPCLDDSSASASMAEFTDTPGWDAQNNAKMWPIYLDGATGSQLQYAAPSRADDLSRLPAAYVLTAGIDPLRDEGIEYAERLMRAGVTVELSCIADAFHGFETAAYSAPITRRAIDAQVHAVAHGLSVESS